MNCMGTLFHDLTMSPSKFILTIPIWLNRNTIPAFKHTGHVQDKEVYIYFMISDHRQKKTMFGWPCSPALTNFELHNAWFQMFTPSLGYLDSTYFT